jgi:hypothetical protein
MENRVAEIEIYVQDYRMKQAAIRADDVVARRVAILSDIPGDDPSVAACEVIEADAADDEEVIVAVAVVSEEVSTEFVPVAKSGFPDKTVVLAGTRDPSEPEVETGSYDPCPIEKDTPMMTFPLDSVIGPRADVVVLATLVAVATADSVSPLDVILAGTPINSIVSTSSSLFARYSSAGDVRFCLR